MYTLDTKWSSKLQANNERKNSLAAQMCVLSAAKKGLEAWSLLIFGRETTSFSKTTLLQNLILRSRNQTQIFSWKITSFSKTVTSEGAVFHNILYYQQLSTACYQLVPFFANILSNYQQSQVPLSDKHKLWNLNPANLKSPKILSIQVRRSPERRSGGYATFLFLAFH